MLFGKDSKKTSNSTETHPLPTRLLTKDMIKAWINPHLSGWYRIQEHIIISDQANSQHDLYGYPNTPIFVHFQDGYIHKDNGPAIKYAGDNLGYLFKYLKNGKVHRDQGPAIVRYELDADCFDGQNFIIDESMPFKLGAWHKEGRQHRIDGHAYICFLHNKTEYSYYYNGTKILKRDFMQIPEVITAHRKKDIKDSLRNSFDDQKVGNE